MNQDGSFRFFVARAGADEAMVDCLVALGANLGPRRESLNGAIGMLRALPDTRVASTSAFFTTKPVGGPAGQDEFLNGAARLSSSLGADQLLSELLRIEKDLGREKTERWGARVVDLDLLLHGEAVVCRAGLILPHPRMVFRRFVLEPAAEIAAEMIHPVLGLTLGELKARLDFSSDQIWLCAASDDGSASLARRLTEIDPGRIAVIESEGLLEDARRSGVPPRLAVLLSPWPVDGDPRVDDSLAAQWTANTERELAFLKQPYLRLDSRAAFCAEQEIRAALEAIR